MRRVQSIAIVLSLLLVAMNLVVGSKLAHNEITDTNPKLPDAGDDPTPMQAPPLPSTIRLWEAWAKGWATVEQGEIGTYIVTNTGPATIIIDEYIMVMSPSPSNPSEDQPGIDDETQDGVLIKTSTVSPGNVLVYNYGSYVVYDPVTFPPPAWWCTEDSEYTNPGIEITMGGEILPYAMVPFVTNPSFTTQDDLWIYMRDNPTLVLGKLPLWEEIANIGDEVDITLDVTNIGFLDATNVVVTDTIPADYSYDPLSFTHTPSSIIPNPDGTTTLKWSISKIDAAVETDPIEPTDYTTVYIGYKLITPELEPDLRIFLPRAYADKNGDGANDAESEEPLLETYFVNRPPVANVDDVAIFEGETAILDGSASYDPDEPYGDYIASYIWDLDGDGQYDDSTGQFASVEYGDNGYYPIGLMVTDSYGANSTDTATITVYNVEPSGRELLVNGDFSDGLNGWDQSLHGYGGLGNPPLPPSNHFTSTANGYLETGAEDGYNQVHQDVEVSCMDLDLHAEFQAVQFSTDGGFVGVGVYMFSDQPPEWSGNPPDSANLPIMYDLLLGSMWWYFRPDYTYISTDTEYFEELGTSPSGWYTLDINLHDIITTHLPGVDESQIRWIKIWTDTYGESGGFTIGNYDNLSLKEPILCGPYSSNEGEELIFTANAFDPGSDDLEFTWDFGDGTTAGPTTYFNDLSGISDPYPSPWGTYPFEATDSVMHTYGDNGVYNVTLTVTDDDGGSIVVLATVIVQNLPPQITSINVTIFVNAPRTQGYWKHQCTVTIPYGDHTGILQEWIDEIAAQSNVFPDIFTKEEVCTILDPDDKSDMLLKAKLQLMALWLNVVSGKLSTSTPIDLPGLTSSTTVGDAIVEIESIILTSSDKDELERAKDIADSINNGIGVPSKMAILIAVASDPGSDDLTFSWSIGIVNTYFNDGAGPDPLPSPWGMYPFEASDTISYPYSSPESITLTVTDDDGGLTTTTIDLP